VIYMTMSKHHETYEYLLMPVHVAGVVAHCSQTL